MRGNTIWGRHDHKCSFPKNHGYNWKLNKNGKPEVSSNFTMKIFWSAIPPHIDFCTQWIIMTQKRWLRTPAPSQCHMHHSQNFDKIDSFLKSVLKIFSLRTYLKGRVRGCWRRDSFLHQICRLRWGVNIYGE